MSSLVQRLAEERRARRARLGASPEQGAARARQEEAERKAVEVERRRIAREEEERKRRIPMLLPWSTPSVTLLYSNVPKSAWQVVIDIVSRRTGILVDDIMGRQRNPPFVDARDIALWVLKTPEASWKEVARRFGRDHTTVIHAARKVDARRLRDPDYERFTSDVQAACRAAVDAMKEDPNGKPSEPTGQPDDRAQQAGAGECS